MKRAAGTLVVLIITLLAGGAFANGGTWRYEITVTNITKGQTFTPILATTHTSKVSLFQLGVPARPQLEILAEGGDTGPLAEWLESRGRHVRGIATTEGLLGPGETVSFEIEASYWHRHLSVAAMLIPTNDTFFALNGVRLPYQGTRQDASPGYDAGTEENDQNCSNIPGPRCGGEGFSAGPNPGDEGYVHIGNGFHELGSEDLDGSEILGPLVYDWRNSVSQISVRRIR